MAGCELDEIVNSRNSYELGIIVVYVYMLREIGQNVQSVTQS
jgi:hypothetical protein